VEQAAHHLAKCLIWAFSQTVLERRPRTGGFKQVACIQSKFPEILARPEFPTLIGADDTVGCFLGAVLL
jgi:hypothetical protein